MAIIKCSCGNHYDNSKYIKCPYCDKGDVIHLEGFRSEDFEKTVGFPVNENRYEETISLQGCTGGDEDEKTVGMYSFSNGTELITGWIVCVKGPPRGKDYGLYHGKNRIGRGLDMDIYIPEDRSISRNEHATIAYEGRSSEFFLMNCKGSLTMLNGSPAEEVTKLETGDRISMGESEFVFIAFCTEDRKWEEE